MLFQEGQLSGDRSTYKEAKIKVMFWCRPRFAIGPRLLRYVRVEVPLRQRQTCSFVCPGSDDNPSTFPALLDMCAF